MKQAFFLALFSLTLASCAMEKTYGVPYSVWKTLTPEQQQSLSTYDQKRIKAKQEWIWRNSAEAQEANAPINPQTKA